MARTNNKSLNDNKHFTERLNIVRQSVIPRTPYDLGNLRLKWAEIITPKD